MSYSTGAHIHSHTHNPSSSSSSFSLHYISIPQTAQINHALDPPQKPDTAPNVSAVRSSIRSAASKLYFLRPRVGLALHRQAGETVESLAPASPVSNAPYTLLPHGIFITKPRQNPSALLVRSLGQGLRLGFPKENPHPVVLRVRLATEGLRLEFPKKNSFLGLENREVSLSRMQRIP